MKIVVANEATRPNDPEKRRKSRRANVDAMGQDPASFNLLEQLKFLEDYCAGNVSMDFADAVEALYKRLRREGKT